MQHRRGYAQYGSRQPLFNNAAAPSDQLQISIEAGQYDLDSEIDQLRSSVGRLKQVSEAISEENRLTAKVMDGLETAMDQARASLRKTMKRLNRAYADSKSNHMLYLVLFAVALFFAVFFWNKVQRLLKWIF